jgi:hypothetical protein
MIDYAFRPFGTSISTCRAIVTAQNDANVFLLLLSCFCKVTGNKYYAIYVSRHPNSFNANLSIVLYSFINISYNDSHYYNG